MKEKLKQLIQDSERILITSHISPDPDAAGSLLLMGSALKTNFPDKQITLTLEEEPLGLEFLKGYDSIEFGTLLDSFRQAKPDLVILLDGNNYSRATRENSDEIREYIRTNNPRTVIIDHHEPEGKDEADVYINQNSPATAQDVYEICFDWLKLKKPDGFAELAMLGLYADTGGFAYKNVRHAETFKLADELVAAGVDIEKINRLLNQYTDDDMLVFGELTNNISHQDGYTYSFISDEFVQKWLNSGKSGAQLHKGTEGFVNNFIRNIGGREWGFITYRNTLEPAGVYSASFRSAGETQDVSKIASKLGGGGHKPAAGAKLKAAGVNEAIQKIKRAIKTA